MPKNNRFYADFLKRWTPAAKKILLDIAQGLRAIGMHVDPVETENYEEHLTWFMNMYPSSEAQESDKGYHGQVSLYFYPQGEAHQFHRSSIGASGPQGEDVQFFNLSNKVDLADDAQIEQIMTEAANRVPDVIRAVQFDEDNPRAWYLPDPERLAHEKLAHFAKVIQEFMTLEKYGDEWLVNLYKEPNLGHLLEVIDDLLNESGLMPKKKSPKDWSPKG